MLCVPVQSEVDVSSVALNHHSVPVTVIQEAAGGDGGVTQDGAILVTACSEERLYVRSCSTPRQHFGFPQFPESIHACVAHPDLFAAAASPCAARGWCSLPAGLLHGESRRRSLRSWTSALSHPWWSSSFSPAQTTAKPWALHAFATVWVAYYLFEGVWKSGCSQTIKLGNVIP